GPPSTAAALTNFWPAKPGLIAELCVPDDAESSRGLLRQLVNDLKEQPLFSKVDLLSDDLRQNLADPKVIIPDRRFVVAFDFAETDFQPGPHVRAPANGRPTRPPPRRSGAAKTSPVARTEEA